MLDKSETTKMNENAITLIVGASENPSRYSFKAVQRLRSQNIPVIAIGKRKGFIGDVEILTGKPELNGRIDTVSLYLNSDRQQDMMDYVLSLRPRRIIFNPGTENQFFEEMARQKGIQANEACTLVMLSTGQY